MGFWKSTKEVFTSTANVAVGVSSLASDTVDIAREFTAMGKLSATAARMQHETLLQLQIDLQAEFATKMRTLTTMEERTELAKEFGKQKAELEKLLESAE